MFGAKVKTVRKEENASWGPHNRGNLSFLSPKCYSLYCMLWHFSIPCSWTKCSLLFICRNSCRHESPFRTMIPRWCRQAQIIRISMWMQDSFNALLPSNSKTVDWMRMDAQIFPSARKGLKYPSTFQNSNSYLS